MLQFFAQAFILIGSLSLQYYYMNKYNHYPNKEMIMAIQLGDYLKASLYFIELIILVFCTIFIVKYFTIAFLLALDLFIKSI